MKKLLVLLLLIIPLAGCEGRIELSTMAICLGIDGDAEGIALTVKYPDYGDDSDGYKLTSARGATWTEAVSALYAATPASLHFGQLREVVIGQGAFDFYAPGDLLSWADQLPGIRAHALTAVCPGTAKSHIEAMQPAIGKRLSKYLDIALSHIETEGRIPATALSCAVRDLSGPWRAPLLAWTEGGAYALGIRQRGLLTPEQMQLFRLITGESQQYRLGSLGCHLRGRTKMAVETENGQDTLLLRLPVTVTYSVYENPPAPGAEEKLQQEITDLLRRLQTLGCDALGFGCMAVRQYDTLAAWLQCGWPERFCQAQVRVEVEAKYRQEEER